MLEGVMVHIWVALNVPRPMEFTAFIDESVKKKSQFLANTGVLLSYLEHARKRFSEQKYMYFL